MRSFLKVNSVSLLLWVLIPRAESDRPWYQLHTTGIAPLDIRKLLTRKWCTRCIRDTMPSSSWTISSGTLRSFPRTGTPLCTDFYTWRSRLSRNSTTYGLLLYMWDICLKKYLSSCISFACRKGFVYLPKLHASPWWLFSHKRCDPPKATEARG